MEFNPNVQVLNVPDEDDGLGPPPANNPQLRRQNAEVLNFVNVNGDPYRIQYGENGSEYITINNVIYPLNTNSNGRYIMMGDNVQPVTGGRRSRKSRRRKSRKSKRSRRV